MTKEIWIILAALLVLLGLGLMAGKIITGRDGAVVVGLCVTATTVDCHEKAKRA